MKSTLFILLVILLFFLLNRPALYRFLQNNKLADLLEPSLVTEAFKTSQFQREHLSLGSDFKEEVIDTDGDGRNNILC